MNVLISVIIPVYNSEKWIYQTLESVYKQEGNFQFEVIVVDDGSTDKSAEIVETHFPEAKLFRTKNNGACSARNLGIKNSSGNLLFLIDSDDYLISKDSIQSLLNNYKNDETIVFGDIIVRYEDSSRRNDIWDMSLCCKDNILNMMKKAPQLGCSLIPKKITRKVLFNTDLICCQEFEFYLNCAIAGFNFKHIDTPICYYRVHNSQYRISVSTGKNYTEVLSKVYLNTKNKLNLHNLIDKKKEEYFDRKFVYLALANYKNKRFAYRLFRETNKLNLIKYCIVNDKRNNLKYLLTAVFGIKVAIKYKNMRDYYKILVK